jgi:hypothetical protein
MAIVAFSVTKRVVYRDSTQEFSNVYHYKTTDPINATEGEARLDEIVAFEKTFHATGVTFVRGRAWNAGGTPAQNDMVVQKNLSGTGALAGTASLDRERAHLFRWPAGQDSRGKPVYLRKWYHALAPINAVAITQSIIEGTTGWTQAQRDSMASFINDIRFIGLSTYQLCAESGRDSTGGAESHKYLEHHQLGDQWRAQ